MSTKEAVLQLLQRAQGDLSGEQLSQQLGLSRAAVWKAVRALRAEGYDIAAGTNRGYRLTAQPDVLTREAVAEALAGHPWAQRVTVCQSVDSTNRMARQMAAQGAPSGTCVIADRQTAGRGRRGRSFYSPPGEGLYMSVVLRPRALPEEIMNLTALVAVGACDAVEAVCGERPGIKWTNDLVLGTKKLAGILTELSIIAETREVEYVVVGIGVNCAQTQFPEDIRDVATSIWLHTGRRAARARLAAALLRAFARLDAQLPGGCAEDMARFRAGCVTLGRRVTILRGDSSREALAEDVAPDGALIVRYDDGTQEHIASGEVSVRGLYGYV